MSITRRRRREKLNHNKSRNVRGGLSSFTSNSSTSSTLFRGRHHTRRKQYGGVVDRPSYFPDFVSKANETVGKGASIVYDSVKDVSNHATEAFQDQSVKILNELKSQAKGIIDNVKSQVNDFTDAALAEFKIKATAAANQAVADALLKLKS